MSSDKKLIEKFQSVPLPKNIDFDEFKKYLSLFGYILVRTAGSHNIFINKEKNLTLCVPTINGKKVKTEYLKQANIQIKKED